MTCNCKTSIEAKLVEHFKRREPRAQNVGAELKGYGMTLGNTLEIVPCMEIAIQADMPLVKGSTKRKKITQTMFFTYCPFCGVKLDRPK